MRYLAILAVICFMLPVFALSGWKNSLIFAGFLCGMFALAFTVKQITGSQAFYLDEWKYNSGEAVVWRDDRADAFPFAKRRALFQNVARYYRNSVIVTNQRIIIAQHPLFSKRMLVTHVLYPGPSPDGQTQHVGGGLLSIGYQSLAYEPGVMMLKSDAKHPCIELKPLTSEKSSVNLTKIYIYTDKASTFKLP